LLSILGPCDGDFGAQVNKLKFTDVLCIDDLALEIDEIKTQGARIVNPTSLFSFDSLSRRYVNSLLYSLFATLFSFLVFPKNFKFEESGIKDYHEFKFVTEERMVATPLFGSPIKLEINLVKKTGKFVKPFSVSQEIMKSPRKNKAASFDVRFLWNFVFWSLTNSRKRKKRKKEKKKKMQPL